MIDKLSAVKFQSFTYSYYGWNTSTLPNSTRIFEHAVQVARVRSHKLNPFNFSSISQNCRFLLSLNCMLTFRDSVIDVFRDIVDAIIERRTFGVAI